MNFVSMELILLNRIEKMKKKLVEIAHKTGMNSQETIAFSQELDNLLNLHMKYFAQEAKLPKRFMKNHDFSLILNSVSKFEYL